MSTYLVFAVDGGDRLTLLCPPKADDPHPLKHIALSFVMAPKMAKRLASGELGQDEACAFDSMELIRSQCLGKQVRFEEDFFIEPLQRASGRLRLPNGDDAAELLLRNGLATTTDRPQPRQPNELFETYARLQMEAKSQKKGVWAPNARSTGVRMLKIMDPSQADDVVAQFKENAESIGRVRVERVLSASTLILTIPSLHIQAPFVLAGVIAPFSKDESDVAADGKFHVERLLLHRMIQVKVQGVDGNRNLVGSVVSAKGTFQEELASKGFVRVNGTTLAFAGPDYATAIQAAEKDAQQKKQGVWRSFVEGVLTVNNGPADTTGAVVPAGGAGAAPGQEIRLESQREFSGIVIQVVSSDTIVVRDGSNGQAVRVSLSGVRMSKSVHRDHDGKSPETRVTYSEYAWEAKELLRTMFIGKAVHVTVDFARVIPETKEVRSMATVVESANRMNLAAQLLLHGFGTFFMGRNDVCSGMMELQAAERSAKERGLGLHSGKEAPATKVVELSRLGEAKGRYYLSFLHRGMQGNRPPVWRGVVDVVLGGGSFRVYIPKEHFQIPFKLAGIVAPSSAMHPGEIADPFATESKDFSILHLQQREVEIQVDTSDRAGNFIGNLNLVGSSNFAVKLVEAGLATVANADKLPYASLLHAAERSAKAAQLNIWSAEGRVPARQSRFDVQNAAASGGDAIQPTMEEGWVPVVLADVADSTTVYLQRNTPEALEAMELVNASIQQAVSGTTTGFVPSKGELVCALFRDDGSWNRAKVLSVHKTDGIVEVSYIDFGTTAELKTRDVRPIPTELASILKDTPAGAFSAKLAFVKDKVYDEYADIASDALFAFAETCNGALFARRVYTNQAKQSFYLIAGSPLSSPAPRSTMSDTILCSGVAQFDKNTLSVPTLSAWAMIASSAQESARKSRLRLWRFGDVGEDSDADE